MHFSKFTPLLKKLLDIDTETVDKQKWINYDHVFTVEIDEKYKDRSDMPRRNPISWASGTEEFEVKSIEGTSPFAGKTMLASFVRGFIDESGNHNVIFNISQVK